MPIIPINIVFKWKLEACSFQKYIICLGLFKYKMINVHTKNVLNFYLSFESVQTQNLNLNNPLYNKIVYDVTNDDM